MLDIRLLGQFSVALDGCPLAIRSRPAQLLLDYLLLNAGAPQPRETLADVLWPDSSPDNARANLRHALWQLRAAIDTTGDPAAAYIVHTTRAIAFDGHNDCTLDVETLQRERPAWTTAALMEAAAAYGGELLPGFYESWIVVERERLAVVFDRRMGRLLERLIVEKRWDDTLAWAERWIELDEAPEPAYRALMQASAALGDFGRVMVAYRRCREALQTELGVEPSPETRRLVESLTRGAAPAEARPAVVVAKPAAGPPGTALSQATAGDRHVLAAALARAEAERQRADRYRMALGLAIVMTGAIGAALSARRQKGRRSLSE